MKIGIGWFFLLPLVMGIAFDAKVGALTLLGMFTFFVFLPIILHALRRGKK